MKFLYYFFKNLLVGILIVLVWFILFPLAIIQGIYYFIIFLGTNCKVNYFGTNNPINFKVCEILIKYLKGKITNEY